MEIKVFCPCGSKYKFDVEPVNERMPWQVNCPTCGADGTAQANEIIAQTLAANPSAPTPVAPAPAPIPAAGLRINRPTPAPAPVATGGDAPPPIAPPRFTPATSRPLAASPKASSSEPLWKKIGTGALAFIVAFLVAFKWIRRIGRFAKVAAVAAAVAHGSGDDSDTSSRERNLMADDQVVLYVKSANQQEVAQECVAFWKGQLHRTFKITTPQQEAGDPGEYVVTEPYNGYVKVMGAMHEWKEPQFEAMAKHLSEKFNTLVFDEKDVDFSGAFIFGVYDQGTNVFHARMDVTAENEKVTTENNDWAIAHGYKPGSDGFANFNIEDADALTKACGMRLWDEPDTLTNYIVLVDPKPPTMP